MNVQQLFVQFVDQQLLFNSGKSLFYMEENRQLTVSPSPATLKMISQHPDLIVSMIAHLKREGMYKETMRVVANKVINLLIEANQFLCFKEIHIIRLQELYERFIRHICALISKGKVTEGTVRNLMNIHYRNLQVFLEETNGKAIFDKYRKHPFLFDVTCASYSADFQLSLLNLQWEDIEEPIMDIGCGQSAELVSFLRETGIEAVGLDRNVKTCSFLINQNYLEHDFAPNTWGTLISHAAFSNHFMHHHLRADGEYKEYARKYMELLRALKKGGSFIYAPGLPFMEKLVQTLSEFHVEAGTYATKITRLF